MRRTLLGTVAALVLVVCAASTTSAPGAQSILPPSSLVFTPGGEVQPKRLPAHEYAPVEATVFGTITTSDATHPSALREAVVDIDKDVKINAKGVPVCRGGARDIRDPHSVPKACRDAAVGKGHAHVEIAFPGQPPIRVASPLTIFNGGEKDGKVTLLVHIVLKVPAPTAVVTSITIARRGGGLHTVVKTPVMAGGSGSTLDFNFKLGKTFVRNGETVDYLEARCPDEVFEVSVPKVLFKNEAQTPGVGSSTVLKGSLAVPCTPKG